VHIICFPTPAALPWTPPVRPVLLATQYISGDERAAIEQVAEIFHRTLVLFILYYLDVRKSSDEMIPKWMVLYGVLYNEEGFSIQEFYPVAHFDAHDLSSTHSTFSWKAASISTAVFMDFFSTPPYYRATAIAALLRIRSHAGGILRKLKEWDSYKHLIESSFIY
jgi:hypothetical protein